VDPIILLMALAALGCYHAARIGGHAAGRLLFPRLLMASMGGMGGAVPPIRGDGRGIAGPPTARSDSAPQPDGLPVQGAHPGGCPVVAGDLAGTGLGMGPMGQGWPDYRNATRPRY